MGAKSNVRSPPPINLQIKLPIDCPRRDTTFPSVDDLRRCYAELASAERVAQKRHAAWLFQRGRIAKMLESGEDASKVQRERNLELESLQAFKDARRHIFAKATAYDKLHFEVSHDRITQ